MLNATQNINAMGRKINCKLIINNTEISNVKELDYNSEWSGQITIGQVISSYFTATIPTPNITLSSASVVLKMHLNTEEIKIGNFVIDPSSIQSKQGYTTFTAYDRFKYATNTYTCSLSTPTTLQAIMNDLCGLIGIQSADLPIDYTISDVDIISGYSIRDCIGFIAAMCGKNAYINADNKLDLRYFANVSYTADGTNANYPYQGENDCHVTRVICQTANGTLASGTGEGISFVCPLMTQSWLDWVLTQVDLTYKKADVDIKYGNFLLQSGDVINVTSEARETIKVPIMSNNWHYDGGVSSKVSAYGVSDYVGTSSNTEQSISARRVLSIMDDKQTKSREKTNTKFLQDEITTATQLITGATGGYIKINFGGDGKTAELLVMDKPDISTADNVWVFNQNGLGHMYRKTDNTFANVNLALTKDGHVVAETIAGEKIKGVAVESTSNDSQVIVKDGQYNINYVYGDSTIPVAKMYYRNRKAVDDTYCFGIDVKKEDGQFSIGSDGNADFFYYADKKPSGAQRFNFFGNVRIESGSLYFSGTNVNDKLDEFERRIQALENR